jgi:hypothetical protein
MPWFGTAMMRYEEFIAKGICSVLWKKVESSKLPVVERLAVWFSTLKIKEATVTSLDASLVSKQQQAAAFQFVPHTLGFTPSCEN